MIANQLKSKKFCLTKAKPSKSLPAKYTHIHLHLYTHTHRHSRQR